MVRKTVITNTSANNREEIISFYQLRTFIGIIGVCLPIALPLGCFILGAGDYSLQPSISHYYYSKMHFIFMGTLCVLGGFLITYRGKPDDPWESRISNIAGYCAFGVAAFPTMFKGFRPEVGGSNQYIRVLDEVTETYNKLHFTFAGSLFICFIIFCLYFFQKPDAVYNLPEEKIKFERRRMIYKICGWGIIISIVLIAIFSFIIEIEEGVFAYATFIFETTSLLFFGLAWLIKGSKIWVDKPVLGSLIKPLR